jgi:hypothetical protein
MVKHRTQSDALKNSVLPNLSPPKRNNTPRKNRIPNKRQHRSAGKSPRRAGVPYHVIRDTMSRDYKWKSWALPIFCQLIEIELGATKRSAPSSI